MEESLLKPAEDVVDLSKVSEADLAKAKKIADAVDYKDSQAVTVFGISAQREISNFSDTVLSEVRAKDSGYVGEILSNLLVNVKDLDVGSLGQSDGFLSKIPIIGAVVDKFKKFMARYQKLSVQIEKILDELDKARMNLLKDITLMDNMYQKNLEYLADLDIYLVAGQLKLKQLKEEVLPGLQKTAETSGDALDAQKLQDFNQFLNRFEKKLHDLKLSRMIAIQSAPQIRLIQNGNQVLVEKIQSSILNTIPLWKNQVVIAITLFRQNKAVKLQKEVSDTTNELMKKNAELLKDSTLTIAKEAERGIVDIETLQKVNNDLISTIEETLKIQKEGKDKRAMVEKELVQIEQTLKQKLIEVKQ